MSTRRFRVGTFSSVALPTGVQLMMWDLTAVRHEVNSLENSELLQKTRVCNKYCFILSFVKTWSIKSSDEVLSRRTRVCLL